ncbi:TonB-dependent receptor domain-containing protein [Arundinibacter roseus]|uniref:TonB-dependent receptor n=1 Tax=Arundinibacter roseus TaxID=2070510 RepID=A0A4R4KB62_9BACT|nr:TonB-dependent receptor [Arundinibacter roseus]TDB63972.1 TonB-dependent receptor [Arundinibacter roseus]
MKKNLLVLFTLAMISLTAQAQFPGGNRPSGDGNGRPRTDAPAQPLFEMNTAKGNSKISGFVVDSTLTKAVEYATVALLDKTTKKPVDGTVADDKGKFSLTKIAEGEYSLLITFIGYTNKTIDGIVVEKGKDLDLGVIKLSVNTIMLDAVNITGEKSLIEEKVDRLVYNAEKDLTSKGGDAADILRKVPMLSVDFDGNVTLRGTSNLRVLINNKPSTIIASNIADALKMIPADLIKSVEVITSPSAKYDAEGSGGIINIITKKSTLEGLTLTLDTGAGLRGSNLGLNGSLRTGKLGVTLGGFGRAFYNKALVTLDQSTIQNGASVLTQQSADAHDFGMFGRYNLGFDYDLAKNQSITAGVNFGTRNFLRDQDFTTKLFTDNILNSTNYRNVDVRDLSNSVDINVDYLRTFKPGQEWSVSTLYSVSNLTNNFDADLLNGSQELTGRQKNLNSNVNKEITLQTDYVNPIGKNQQIEVGVKGIFREVNSDFQYQIAGASGLFATDVRNPAGMLNYNQNIAAGYLSYTFATANKYTFKIGSRFEHTMIDAKDQISEIDIPSYSNLVPSINISKAIGKASTLKLAYNKRIQRPGLQQLNPNFNLANTQNISIGNPSLKPELTDNVELSLSTSFKKTYLNLSLFGRTTSNGITRISTPSDTLLGAVVTTFENIGHEQTFGANVFGNVYLTPKWTLNGGVDLYYNYLEGQQNGLDGTSQLVSNSGFVIGGRVQSQVQLPKGWGIQAFGGFRGNRIQLQGVQGGMGMYSLGLRKEFANKKGSLGLAADNFFGGMKIKSTLNSPLFNQVSVNNIYNQNIKITFSYKIGKMTLVEKKKTKSVRNDDVIGGESN